MEFVRKKKRGQTGRSRKTWLSAENYRIVWRREVCGVRLPARFQATVRVVIPNYGGHEGESHQMWDFTDERHRLFKVRGKAEESCERHRRLWMKACEAAGIRGLLDIFGKLPVGIPLWVRKKLPRKIYLLLTEHGPSKRCKEDEDECSEPSPLAGKENVPGDLTRTSDSSLPVTDAVPTTDTPASTAEDMGKSTTRTTRRTRLKATETSDESATPSAKAPAAARKKRAKKRTARSSKRGKKSETTTTGSPQPAKPRSRGSRTKKSVP
ncbi:MAG: hypothetical protein ABFC88_12470 [Thermoguttaceae bacterium]